MQFARQKIIPIPCRGLLLLQRIRARDAFPIPVTDRGVLESIRSMSEPYGHGPVLYLSCVMHVSDCARGNKP